MVSGFLISPYDQLRIFSGLAIEIFIKSNICTGTWGLNGSITWLWLCIQSLLVSVRSRGEGREPDEACFQWMGESGGLLRRLLRSFEFGFMPRRRKRVLFGHVEFDIETERTDFLNQNVEAFGDAGFERVVTAHNGFVDLGAAGDVVGLDGQHFLQRIGGTVGFEGPHLHFAEALAAELRLATERLLGDERVRADRTGVDLVVDQVVELQHVDVAHGHLAVEGLAGAAVIDGRLARGIEPGTLQHLDDVGFLGAIEHGGRERHALAQMLAEANNAVVVEIGHRRVALEDLADLLLARLAVALRLIDAQHLVDLLAAAGAGPGEVRREALP